MPNDELNIKDSLSFSKQQDGLIQGQQMGMQQVLVDKQCLRIIIRSQNDIIAQLEEHVKKLQQENTDKDKTIERLNAENKLFRTTSTQPQIAHTFPTAKQHNI